MNMKVDIIESEEGPGYGAAILAAVGCGVFPSVEEAAKKLVKVVATEEPDPELTAKYEERISEVQKAVSGAERDVLKEDTGETTALHNSGGALFFCQSRIFRQLEGKGTVPLSPSCLNINNFIRFSPIRPLKILYYHVYCKGGDEECLIY